MNSDSNTTFTSEQVNIRSVINPLMVKYDLIGQLNDKAIIDEYLNSMNIMKDYLLLNQVSINNQLNKATSAVRLVKSHASSKSSASLSKASSAGSVAPQLTELIADADVIIKAVKNVNQFLRIAIKRFKLSHMIDCKSAIDNNLFDINEFKYKDYWKTSEKDTRSNVIPVSNNEESWKIEIDGYTIINQSLNYALSQHMTNISIYSRLFKFN